MIDKHQLYHNRYYGLIPYPILIAAVSFFDPNILASNPKLYQQLIPTNNSGFKTSAKSMGSNSFLIHVE